MLVFISLFLLVLAGVGASAVPPSFFNLESSLSSGKLSLWISAVRAFGVPLSLFLLKISKNHYIKLACALWGTFMTLFTLIILMGISRFAPSVNLYGVLFTMTVFICSTSVAVFSWIDLASIFRELLERSEKPEKNAKKDTSIEIEGTYQTPTNPS